MKMLWVERRALPALLGGPDDRQQLDRLAVGLQYTGITDLHELAQLSSLLFLDLSGLTINDASCSTLTGMKQLQTLVLNRARIEIRCLDGLREALPHCSIQYSPPHAKTPSVDGKNPEK